MQQEQGKYNKKRLAALAVLVLLLLILIFLIWWWFAPRPSTISGPQPTATEPARDTVVLPSQEAPAVVDPRSYAPAPGETEVRALARNFTERYGSWSTDSDFQNLKDLFPRVTSRLQTSFERTISSAAAPTEFRSAETRVLQITIESLTATKASILVTAQQTVRSASLEAVDSFVNLSLTMIKDGEYWYVDSAEWK